MPTVPLSSLLIGRGFSYLGLNYHLVAGGLLGAGLVSLNGGCTPASCRSSYIWGFNMVTALKDRTRLEAIKRIPINRVCPHCSGRLYLENNTDYTDYKCLNCSRSVATWYNKIDLK